MDGHMLGISLVEISTTKLWRLSHSEITANQQSYIKLQLQRDRCTVNVNSV